VTTALSACLGLVVLAGCGEDQTGQPGIPDVDFAPRLVVTVDDEGLDALIGPRGEGDEAVGTDPARMPVPGVLELRFSGDGEHRVVGYLTPPGEQPPDLSDRDVATPAPLLDSGIQLDGDAVTVVLEDPGTLELSPLADPDQRLVIILEPAAD
jgi:hypothetical protein